MTVEYFTWKLSSRIMVQKYKSSNYHYTYGTFAIIYLFIDQNAFLFHRNATFNQMIYVIHTDKFFTSLHLDINFPMALFVSSSCSKSIDRICKYGNSQPENKCIWCNVIQATNTIGKYCVCFVSIELKISSRQHRCYYLSCIQKIMKRFIGLTM